MTPIPVILITGGLGAGKTTLVNHLLSRPDIAARDVALIVNEFGDVGVDGALVRSEGRPLYEIRRGSLFCACTQVEFLTTLQTIASGSRPGLVLIEATGIADPADLEQHFDQPALAGAFSVRANLCLVDVTRFVEVAAYLKAAVRQVARADGLIINKCDLVSPEALAELDGLVADIQPRAKRVAVEAGRIPDGFIDALEHTRYPADLADRPPPDLVTASFETEQATTRARLDTCLRTLRGKVLRLKGNLLLEDGLVFYEVVHDRAEEKAPVSRLGASTRFSVIARGVTRDALRASFDALWEA